VTGLLLLSGTDVHFNPHDHKVHVFPKTFIFIQSFMEHPYFANPLIQLVKKHPYFAESTYSIGYETSLFC
jgi:hypothetical protein